MSAQIESFGLTSSQEPVTAVTLCNETLRCRLISYSAAIQSLSVPSKDGAFVDVVLGYDTLREYQENTGCLGAVCGRYANRICKGSFRIDKTVYQLNINNGPNHLHGGPSGYNTRNWTVDSVTDTNVTLSIDSPDGDENYPGHLHLTVSYSIDASSLCIRYLAESDRKTICNITNHSYFNLSGHDSGPMLDQIAVLYADTFTPIDETLIPTGEIVSVQNTPFDFTSPHRIGERISADDTQLKNGNGYDHNYVLNGSNEKIHPFAEVYSEKTGICMRGFTTSPGVQFYTGNHLTERAGKCGTFYGPHSGFCLETQFFPDSPNHPNFPSTILEPGQCFDQMTRLEFSVK